MLGDLSPTERGRLQQFTAYNAITMPIEERARLLRAGTENIGMSPHREALSNVVPGAVGGAGITALGLLSLPGISASYQRSVDSMARKPGARAAGRAAGLVARTAYPDDVKLTVDASGEFLADNPERFSKAYGDALGITQGHVATKADELVDDVDIEDFVNRRLNLYNMANDPETAESFRRGVFEGIGGERSAPYGEGRLARRMFKAEDPIVDAISYAAKAHHMDKIQNFLGAIRKRKGTILLGAAGLGGLIGGLKSLRNLSRLQRMEDEDMQEHLLQSDLNRSGVRGPGIGSLTIPLMSLASSG